MVERCILGKKEWKYYYERMLNAENGGVGGKRNYPKDTQKRNPLLLWVVKCTKKFPREYEDKRGGNRLFRDGCLLNN